jgi:hypothetical protein
MRLPDVCRGVCVSFATAPSVAAPGGAFSWWCASAVCHVVGVTLQGILGAVTLLVALLDWLLGTQSERHAAPLNKNGPDHR